jgi:hypothetical protein
MNRPSLFVRVAGYPLVALALLLSCLIFVVGWYHGQVSWVLGVSALWLGLQTLAAVRQRRGYKAWMAQWNAIGSHGEARPAPKSRWFRSLISIVAVIMSVILVLLIPVYLSAPSEYTSQLIIVWLLAALYLAVKVFRRLRRRKTVARADAVVTWLLGSASSSPSPAQAAKALPEYSARLLFGNNQRPRIERQGNVSTVAG